MRKVLLLLRWGTTPVHDFGARILPPAIPFWTTPDPCAEKYYDLGPYTFCAADPINHSDPSGAIIQTVIGKLNYRYENRDGQWGFYCGDKMYEGGNDFVDRLLYYIGILQNKSVGNELVSSLVDADDIIQIANNDNKGSNYCADNKTLNFDSLSRSELLVVDSNSGLIGYEEASPYLALAHEMFHAEDFLRGYQPEVIGKIHGKEVYSTEHWAIMGENFIRKEQGDNIRVGYEVGGISDLHNAFLPNTKFFPDAKANRQFFSNDYIMRSLLQIRRNI